MYFKIINQYEKDNTTEEQVNDKKKKKQANHRRGKLKSQLKTESNVQTH